MKFLLLITLLLNFAFANIGFISAIKGKATLTRGEKEIPITLGLKLEKKDQIKTNIATKVQLLFNDKTIITIGKNSTFSIYEYLYDEKQKTKQKAKFGFAKGIFRTITGRIAKTNPSKFTVKVKSASIGIRGTKFDVFVDNKNIKVSVAKGGISLTLNQTTTDVDPGEMVVYKTQTKTIRKSEGILKESSKMFDKSSKKEKSTKTVSKKETAKNTTTKKSTSKKNTATVSQNTTKTEEPKVEKTSMEDTNMDETNIEKTNIEETNVENTVVLYDTDTASVIDNIIVDIPVVDPVDATSEDTTGQKEPIINNTSDEPNPADITSSLPAFNADTSNEVDKSYTKSVIDADDSGIKDLGYGYWLDTNEIKVSLYGTGDVTPNAYVSSLLGDSAASGTYKGNLASIITNTDGTKSSSLGSINLNVDFETKTFTGDITIDSGNWKADIKSGTVNEYGINSSDIVANSNSDISNITGEINGKFYGDNANSLGGGAILKSGSSNVEIIYGAQK